MQRKIRYTEEEDNIIIQCVSESPNNLERAFRKASTLLNNRTVTSVSMRWYNRLRNRPSTKVVFMTLGKGKVNINRKVERENSPKETINVRVGIFSRVLTALFGRFIPRI